jgi:transposase-like protein
MPWSTNTVSELRTAFVHAVRTAGRSVTQAAKDFNISRKTAYKWLARFDQQQPMADGSRRPHHSPTRTTGALEAAVLAVRDQFGWGPRKIHAYLTNGQQPAPPARTVGAILRRHNRITQPPAPEGAGVRFERSEPNHLWQVDFKGTSRSRERRCTR